MDAAVAQPLEKPVKKISPVDALVDLIRDDLYGVNRLIVERMESHVPMIPTLARSTRPMSMTDTFGCALTTFR